MPRTIIQVPAMKDSHAYLDNFIGKLITHNFIAHNA